MYGSVVLLQVLLKLTVRLTTETYKEHFVEGGNFGSLLSASLFIFKSLNMQGFACVHSCIFKSVHVHSCVCVHECVRAWFEGPQGWLSLNPYTILMTTQPPSTMRPLPQHSFS